MADSLTISIVAGDAVNLDLAYTDKDTGAAIDLSGALDGTAARPAVLRWGAKVKIDEEDASILKTTYIASEAVIADQTAAATKGHATVFLDEPDTEDVDPDTYSWAAELTRQDTLRTAAGTVSLTTANTVAGVGTQFTKGKKGDVFQPLGASNTKPVLIEAITSDTSLTLDAAIYTAEAGILFEIRRGFPVTEPKKCGKLVIEEDPVRSVL